jgi:hypothetical protein
MRLATWLIIQSVIWLFLLWGMVEMFHRVETMENELSKREVIERMMLPVRLGPWPEKGSAESKAIAEILRRDLPDLTKDPCLMKLFRTIVRVRSEGGIFTQERIDKINAVRKECLEQREN